MSQTQSLLPPSTLLTSGDSLDPRGLVLNIGFQVGPPPTGAGVAVRVLMGAEGCVASAVAELLRIQPVDVDGRRATTSRRCRSNPEACRGTALTGASRCRPHRRARNRTLQPVILWVLPELPAASGDQYL